MSRLLNYIGRVLCMCAVLCLLAGCANTNVPSGTVVDVRNDNTDCDCFFTYTYDGERQFGWMDCPCSTQIGDTLIAQ